MSIITSIRNFLFRKSKKVKKKKWPVSGRDDTRQSDLDTTQTDYDDFNGTESNWQSEQYTEERFHTNKHGEEILNSSCEKPLYERDFEVENELLTWALEKYEIGDYEGALKDYNEACKHDQRLFEARDIEELGNRFRELHYLNDCKDYDDYEDIED